MIINQHGMILILKFICIAIACMFSIATFFAVDIAKRMVGRHRPRHFAARRYNVRMLINNPAMPSGDSAQAAVWACVLSRLFGTPVFLALIPSTMFARVFYGAHWIGDTIVGAAIGCFVEHLCNTALDRWCTAVPSIDSSFNAFMCAR